MHELIMAALRIAQRPSLPFEPSNDIRTPHAVPVCIIHIITFIKSTNDCLSMRQRVYVYTLQDRSLASQDEGTMRDG